MVPRRAPRRSRASRIEWAGASVKDTGLGLGPPPPRDARGGVARPDREASSGFDHTSASLSGSIPPPPRPMTTASLVRTVRFSAGHRYWRPEWSEERNRETFGPSVHAHGHNYAVHVTVRGVIDEETGFVVDLAALDRLLQEEVVEPLDSRDLTVAVERFRPGGEIPSGEALARWIFERLRGRVPGGGRVARVRVEESDTLAAEYGEGDEGGDA